MEDAARQRPAFEALHRTAVDYPQWPIHMVSCTRDTDYEEAVRRLWGGPFVIWEHDIEPDPTQVAALIACPEPFCAWDYPLYRSEADLARYRAFYAAVQTFPAAMRDKVLASRRGQWLVDLYLNHRGAESAHRVNLPNGRVRWSLPEDDYADFVGFGLTKFAGRVPTPDWPPGTWHDLDSRVSAYLADHGVRWHLHQPALIHHHPA